MDQGFFHSREFVFAALAMVVSIIRYGGYLWSIYKKETRPHVFTWFNWGLVVGIGAFAQRSLEGGASVWVLALVSGTCLFIAGVALFVGEKTITRGDWFAFIGALIAIPVWLGTDNAFYAIVTLIIIDMLSYYPTVRKSWSDPWGEPPVSYVWAGSRYLFAMGAVPEFSVHTLLYPFFLGATDFGFAGFVAWRRARLRN